MAKAIVLLGSNRGDRAALLEKAQQRIAQDAGDVSKVSALYESEPWGFEDDTPFLNQVLIIETKWSPNQLLHKLLDIETGLGRTRKNAHVYSSRPIDIDILFYDDLIIDDAGLKVPHPRMQFRKFTLMPLSELWPDLIHPVLKKPVKELLRDCEDQLNVKKLVTRASYGV
jgi:2-amino-4-hydroxy-6-hydroxymethyldihydropteridine diphosphokinase